MIHRIEIVPVPRHGDPLGRGVRERIARFTHTRLAAVRTSAVYAFDAAAAGLADGAAKPEALRALGRELFADPVLHETWVDAESLERILFDWYVEVGFGPGVTDNVGRTAQESLEYRLRRKFPEGHHVHTATGYFIAGHLSREEIQALADEWLAGDSQPG